MEGQIFEPVASPTTDLDPRDQVLHALALQRDSIMQQYKPITIETAEQKQWASEALVVLDHYVKLVDEKDEQFCKPLYDHWKMMKGEFKKLKEPAEKLKTAIQSALSDCRRRELDAVAKEQKRQNDLAIKRQERAIESGRGLPLPVAVAPIVQDTGKTVETASGDKVTWIDNYVPRIIDESLIPRKYLMPDMVKIKAMCKAGEDIPGVQRVNEPYPRVTG